MAPYMQDLAAMVSISRWIGLPWRVSVVRTEEGLVVPTTLPKMGQQMENPGHLHLTPQLLGFLVLWARFLVLPLVRRRL